MTPSGDLTQTQYFDPPAPPTTLSPSSSPDSSPPGFPHSTIHIDSLTNEDDNDVEIKATLPEEFSRETRDANR